METPFNRSTIDSSPRASRSGNMSRESTTGRPSAVRVRSSTTTSSPGCSSSRSASSAEAASIRTAAFTVPATIPDARMASVTPKFASRLFAIRGRSATNVSAPRFHRTNPSSSRDRSASRSVDLETPSSAASSGSGGSWLPGGTSLMRETMLPRAETVFDLDRSVTPHPSRQQVFVGQARASNRDAPGGRTSETAHPHRRLFDMNHPFEAQYGRERPTSPKEGWHVAERKVGSVTYQEVSEEYFKQRGLRRHAGVWMLWALGVGAVISGDYYGWNFGLSTAGFGGLVIATVLIAVMYYGLCYSIAEMSPALPHTGGAYSFARSAMGPWGGFLTGLAGDAGDDEPAARGRRRAVPPVRHRRDLQSVAVRDLVLPGDRGDSARGRGVDGPAA